MRGAKFIFAVILGLSALTARAQQVDSTVAKVIAENHELIEQKTANHKAYRHEIRLGVGDGFFDTIAFQDTPHRPYSMYSPGLTYIEQQNHTFLPHFFAEYNWTPDNRWSFGVQLDFFGFKWLIQTTDFSPVGARIGIKIDPDGFHIMKKSRYSGMFGDYSSYSDEYDEISDPDYMLNDEDA